MEFSFPTTATISVLFLGVAFLYSSVGHGGASGYLAVLSFFTVAPAMISTTALILNLLVASVAFVAFARAKHFSGSLTWPFIITSVPAAFLGGLVRVSVQLYLLSLAAVLFIAALRFLLEARSRSEQASTGFPPLPISLPVGVGVGFISGLVGVGGGIFLSPFILLMGWADAKHTSATSAAFIFVNSLAGLFGRFARGGLEVGGLLPFVAAAFLGGFLGSYLGARRYSNRTIRRILGVVLVIASAKLFLTTY